MSRETNFTGWWEGEVEITCDCCGKKHIRFQCTCEDDFKNYAREKAAKKKEGWVTTKVNGHYFEFCGFDCRDKFIRNNTI